MRLLTSPMPVAPNPRVVRMVMAEKRIDLDVMNVDIMSGENRRPPFLALNPTGEVPALELDDGRVLAESVAIAEYLDELRPDPPLIGTTPEERALTRMWTRRVDFKVAQPLTAAFRAAEGLPLFRDRVRCLPQAADELKATVREGVAWLDEQLGDRPFLTGAQVRLPDILLYCFLEFGAQVAQPPPPHCERIAAWRTRMASRPSAQVADPAKPAVAQA